jgi:phage shock protein A
MIQEMEDTLVEMKASCAGAMAERSRLQRTVRQAREQGAEWSERARLAVEKGRDDLAREAIVQKRHFEEDGAKREEEVSQLADVIQKHQHDIEQLESKLATARRKYKVLLQRHKLAHERKRAQTKVRQVDTSDAFTRFELVENRVNRLEAEADLVNSKRKPDLETEFQRLEKDEEVEAELQALKDELRAPPPQTAVEK